MLNVTSNAMTMCHATIVQLSNAQSRTKCLRFDKKEGQRLALVFDNPRKSDAIISHDGVAVIAVPEEVVGLCADKTLDIDDQGKLTLS
jgi:hypothetical protein